MSERFNDAAHQVIGLAEQEARRLHHQYIGTEHILLGLVKLRTGVAVNALVNSGATLADIVAVLEKVVRPIPDKPLTGTLPQSPRAQKVIQYAAIEARWLNHNHVGPEHLLLGLIREKEGVAAKVLAGLGLTLEGVREQMLELLGQRGR